MVLYVFERVSGLTLAPGERSITDPRWPVWVSKRALPRASSIGQSGLTWCEPTFQWKWEWEWRPPRLLRWSFRGTFSLSSTFSSIFDSESHAGRATQRGLCRNAVTASDCQRTPLPKSSMWKIATTVSIRPRTAYHRPFSSSLDQSFSSRTCLPLTYSATTSSNCGPSAR